MDDLLQEFIAETRDTLEALSGEVIAWEADPSDRARLDSIFRFVHTVKGSCGFLDLPRFERLSHAAEDVLADLRSGTRQPDVATVSAVLAVLDRIGELTEALDAGEEVGGDDAHLVAALKVEAIVPAAALAVPSSGSTHQPARAPTRSIRIPLDLLDQMMSGVSDMVLARNELARRLRGIDEPGMEGAFERLSACVAEMRASITRTRMQRIDKLFGALPRMVRDLSSELGKSIELDVVGGDVELDREMIELIRDPLTHIVRNAVDHGIEPPAERVLAGKPVAGLLRVLARQSGNQIVIELADDGRGIDEARLVAKAVAAGVIGAEAVDALARDERAALIFAPGLSTANSISAISGRGVGMDVVRANIERIGGVIEVDNRPGQGLRLLIRVPLTLTIIAALTVTAGGQSFAVPRGAIEEICHDGGEAIRIDQVGGTGVVTIRGRALPLVDLERVLGLEPPAARGRTLVVLRAASGCTYALGVAHVHDHEELVIRPASPAVMGTGLYAGKSLPDSGVPMLLLDVSGIAAVAGVEAEAAEIATSTAALPAAAPVEDRIQTLLFRDLDGVLRGIRLSLIERIEDADTASISFSAGFHRIVLDGRIVALVARGDLTGTGSVKVVRMTDGHVELAYAIRDVIDIVALPAALAPSAAEGIVGVALQGDRQVEMVDPHHLFARVAAADPAEPGPLVLIADADDPWMRDILAPLVRAAGYRTAFGTDEAADVVIQGARSAPVPAGAPVVRLLADPAAAAIGGVYRYDRGALLDAVRAAAGGR